MDDQQMVDAVGEVAAGANAKLRETLDRVGDAASAATEGAKAAADQLRSAGAEAGARLKEAGKRSGEALDGLSRRGSEIGRYLSDVTATSPLAAVLVAAAIGYGLARVIRWP
jgi:ElaB/YqjD/DUF883 family membrane-anchored ribosome-binding protein